MFTPTYWPTSAWRTSTAEEQGLSSRGIAQALREIEERVPRLHSLLLVRNGYVVTEAYFYPYGPDWRHGVASCTKAVISSLVGAAIQQGYIKSIQQRMLEFFPGREVANRDARKEAITLEHLLSMSSGLHCVYNGYEKTLYDMRASKDWAQFMLDQPMDHEPGTHFFYNSGASHLVSVILSQATGRSALEFAREHLFGPMGVQDVAWPADPQGHSCGWGQLQLQPRDMAKFGYLFLCDGVWEGQRILPAGWVAESTRFRFDPKRGQGYGFFWWLRSVPTQEGLRSVSPEARLRSPDCVGVLCSASSARQSYFAAGIGMQVIDVTPATNMVCVVTGSTDEEDRPRVFHSLEQHVIGSGQASACAADPEGQRLLQDHVAAVARPLRQPVSPLPTLAGTISGRTYSLEPSPLGWRTLALHFSPGSDIAHVSYNAGQLVAVDLDGVPRVTAEPERSLRSAWRGWWEDDTFVLDYDTLSLYRRYRMRFSFNGDVLSVSYHEYANGVDERFGGRAV